VDETPGRSFENRKTTSIVRNHASCQIPAKVFQGRGDSGLRVSQRGWDQHMEVLVQAALHNAIATEECH
jgi:hypothetical protein